MAGEYQVLASLNRMLESKERREQTRLQNSLAMMQFAQQKKMQDYQLASNQIAVLQQANQQVQMNEAQRFVSETGIGAFDLESEDGVKSAREYLTKKVKYSHRTGVNKGGLGLTEVQSNQLLSNVMALKSGNYAPMISMATDLADIADKESKGIRVTGEEKKFFNAFQEGLGYFDDASEAKERLGNIRQAAKDANDIVREQYELAQGDTKIRKTLGGYGTDEYADLYEEIEEAASKPVLQPEEEFFKTKEYISELETEVGDKKNSIVTMDKELLSLKALEKHGKLTDEQKEYLRRIPSIRQNIETDIMDLSNQIDQNSKLAESLKETVNQDTPVTRGPLSRMEGEWRRN